MVFAMKKYFWVIYCGNIVNWVDPIELISIGANQSIKANRQQWKLDEENDILLDGAVASEVLLFRWLN